VTAVLFTAGKALIALYVGRSDVAAGFGAASTIIIVLVWLYYSGLIFLAGAEFTRAWASRSGSKQAAPVPAKPGDAVVAPRIDQSGSQHQSVPGPRREPSAIEQVLVALLPFVIAYIVNVAMDRRTSSRRIPSHRGWRAAFNHFR
jgi:hypothetical protein